MAGPFATQLLADFGAEVIKIEPPTGDPTRSWGEGPTARGCGETPYFMAANRGKRSLVADLSNPEHAERLQDYIKASDVLVENFLPDTAERLGLTWERLHENYPRLILASVRGFASDVPAFRKPGYDFILQAEAGWMSITGSPDGPPTKVGVALVDVVAALYLANGIQAAMLHRERTGEAMHVEVPLMESALAALVNVASESLVTGVSPERHGNSHPYLVPYRTFQAEDGELALGVGNDRQFEVLALWCGIDLEQEPQWRHNPGRVQDRNRLEPLLQAHFADRKLKDILAFCDAHAIPASRVRTVDDALFREAGRLHRLIQPLFDESNGQMVPTLASPILFNDQRACSPLPPPRWRR